LHQPKASGASEAPGQLPFLRAALSVPQAEHAASNAVEIPVEAA